MNDIENKLMSSRRARAPHRAVKALAVWALGIAGMAGTLAPVAAQAQVSVSVGVNQPGVYGRVDFGGGPPPPVIYQQPVIIAPPPVAVPRSPIYLRVPPGYETNWGRYCARYAACGQPVYFVRDMPPPPPPRYIGHDDRRFDRHGPPRGRGHWDRGHHDHHDHHDHH